MHARRATACEAASARYLGPQSGPEPALQRKSPMPDSIQYDPSKFILTAQVGGIEAYTLDEGPARGVRALCVNTGGGLRYRVLVDRGLDIDRAFHNHNSVTFLAHKGVTPPTRGFDRGLDWLKGFPVGLLT